ncbi:lysophospholipid acyltransferase family protein [Mesorhizobium sp. LHD-90]|uniref:lysophospholipid acyltransferase family protein n=1 Tax=Mesorhizobium sp. LHD-90 TaxID=3071414 RepID=UPI0027E09B7A|nr:lysophospholipid acyltransferase family protein [Mesorhizobium sp. LHD-90]MDQ6435546.1 lysophospholipid acyltransferase family protein [Mesorhizobium sp. LHD-90]
MIATVRSILALTVVAGATVVLAPWQVFSLKTGLGQGRRVPLLWHRLATRMLGIRIRTFGTIAQGRPLLIASNHVSWLDITVLGAVAEVSFIAKSEMSNWPVFGWLAKMQRSVFVERERRRKSGDQAGEIAGRLADGDVMVLFAEGTTGDGNMLLPFKTTLFGAASMMLSESHHDEMWIQPVAIAYTRLQGLPMGRQYRGIAAWIGDEDLVPHLRQVLREGAIDVEVHFGEPVVFTAKSNRKAIARLAEARVRDLLGAALANPAPHS